MKTNTRRYYRLTARLFHIRAAWRGQVPLRVAVQGAADQPAEGNIPIVLGQRNPFVEQSISTSRAA